MVYRRNFYVCHREKEVEDPMSSWSDREWIRKPRRGLEYVAARAPVVKRTYWRYAPEYYRWKIRHRIDHDAPLDPLKIVWVNPDRISRMSGRKDVIYDRWQDIGTVRKGDWDQCTPREPTGPRKKHVQGVFYAEKIEDTDIFRSFESRFKSGIRWEETSLFQSIHSAINDGITIWRGSQSREDILARCRKIDDLYQEIKNQGYKSQFELFQQHELDTEHVGFLDVLTDEVSIDIARDGELLFADGRHRICLAKVLGLEAIPVVVLVRHRQWLERREEIYRDRKRPEITTHPDLAEAVTENEYRMLEP